MRHCWLVWCGALMVGLLVGCFSRGPGIGESSSSEVVRAASFHGKADYVEEGIASWYGGQFHGRQTANGEVFDSTSYTAAHRTLPFNTMVVVTNLDNNRQVQVRINDRGPFVPERIIDLSRAAAEALGMMTTGTARVRLEVDDLKIESNPEVLVQLASYRDRENAAKLVRKLQEKGYRPIIEFRGEYYRVVLQKVPRDQVDAMRPELAELGITDLLVRMP